MQLTWDMAEAMNLELRQLVAAGCKVIQIESPRSTSGLLLPQRDEAARLPRRLLHREVEGLDDAEL